MFHLVKGLYTNYNKKEEYSVLILGLDNAGKTTFLEKLKSMYNNTSMLPANRIRPTVGQNIGSIEVDNKFLKFWDLGGQESLRSLWENYFEDAHGIIFIVDSTDEARLNECKETLLNVITKNDNLPILMLANKQDIENHLEVEDIKEIFNKIAQHLNARDSRVLPISALNGDGIKEAIEWLKVRVERNKQNNPPKYR